MTSRTPDLTPPAFPQPTARRGVLKTLGLALLTVQVLPSIGRASVPAPGGRDGAGGDLLIHSSRGFAFHTHDLRIAFAVLRAPPRQGVSIMSTRALGHAHQVALSRDQLIQVSHGGTVAVAAGSHTFVIKMAKAVRDRTTAPPMKRNDA